MTAHGAKQTAHQSRCNSTVASYSHGPSTLCTASRHGTSTAYREGCRCPNARAVMARAQRLRVKRRYLTGPLLTDATGTHRRLRALQANGWPRRVLARRLGYTSGCLPEFTHNTLHVDTAAKVSALYDLLADIPGPSNSARIRARAKGWLPPIWLDDDTINDPDVVVQGCQKQRSVDLIPDPIAVERFTAGDDTVTLNRAEKSLAYKEMDRRGIPRHEIARRLRISGTTARQFAAQETVGASRLLDQETVVARRCNNSGAEQGCSPTRLQTETPECPGGRPMPSIAAATNDRFAEVAS